MYVTKNASKSFQKKKAQVSPSSISISESGNDTRISEENRDSFDDSKISQGKKAVETYLDSLTILSLDICSFTVLFPYGLLQISYRRVPKYPELNRSTQLPRPPIPMRHTNLEDEPPSIAPGARRTVHCIGLRPRIIRSINPFLGWGVARHGNKISATSRGWWRFQCQMTLTLTGQKLRGY